MESSVLPSLGCRIYCDLCSYIRGLKMNSFLCELSTVVSYCQILLFRTKSEEEDDHLSGRVWVLIIGPCLMLGLIYLIALMIIEVGRVLITEDYSK